MNIDTLSPNELKNELAKYGLNTEGVRTALRERLTEHLRKLGITTVPIPQVPEVNPTSPGTGMNQGAAPMKFEIPPMILGTGVNQGLETQVPQIQQIHGLTALAATLGVQNRPIGPQNFITPMLPAGQGPNQTIQTLTPAEIAEIDRTHSIKTLKAELALYNEHVSGTKSQLVERLALAIAKRRAAGLGPIEAPTTAQTPVQYSMPGNVAAAVTQAGAATPGHTPALMPTRPVNLKDMKVTELDDLLRRLQLHAPTRANKTQKIAILQPHEAQISQLFNTQSPVQTPPIPAAVPIQPYIPPQTMGLPPPPPMAFTPFPNIPKPTEGGNVSDEEDDEDDENTDEEDDYDDEDEDFDDEDDEVDDEVDDEEDDEENDEDDE